MKLEKLNELLNVTSADCFFAFEPYTCIGDEFYRYCNSGCKLKKQLAKLKEENKINDFKR